MRYDLLRESGLSILKGEMNWAASKVPQLRDTLEISLKTPQISEYHCEGDYLEDHLAVMLELMNELVFRNATISEVDTEALKLVKNFYYRDYEDSESDGPEEGERLNNFIFFHDIGKPFCMTVTTLQGEHEIDWSDWKEHSEENKKYRGEWIEKISYFQKDGNGQHGNYASELIIQDCIEDKGLHKVIKNHEIAYQFAKINAKTYADYFGDWTRDEQDFLMVASLLDTGASFRENGRPDFANFNNLWQSRKNYELVQEVLNGREYDQNKYINLLKQNRVLMAEDVKPIIKKKYDTWLLTIHLDKYYKMGWVTTDELKELLPLKNKEVNQWLSRKFAKRMGKTFGKFMAEIKEKCMS